MSREPYFIGAVHLFILRNHQVLLLRRANTGYEDGNWSVPAGHIEPHETPTEAVIREALEETGLRYSPRDVSFAHVMHRYADDGKRIDYFFIATRLIGTPKIMESDHCSALEWHEIENLPKNTIPYIASALKEILSDSSYSEFGFER